MFSTVLYFQYFMSFLPLGKFLYVFCLLNFIIIECIYDLKESICIPRHIFGSQKTSVWSWLSFSFMWVPRIGQWFSGLHGKCLQPVSHLSCPYLLFAISLFCVVLFIYFPIFYLIIFSISVHCTSFIFTNIITPFFLTCIYYAN